MPGGQASVVPDRSADFALWVRGERRCSEDADRPDDWSGYASLGLRGYEHFAVARGGDPEVAEDYLPIIHLGLRQSENVAHRHPWCQPISIFKPIQ